MKTTLVASTLALGMITSAALAEPANLTNAQLGEVTAGLSFELADLGEVLSILAAEAVVSENTATSDPSAAAAGVTLADLVAGALEIAAAIAPVDQATPVE